MDQPSAEAGAWHLRPRCPCDVERHVICVAMRVATPQVSPSSVSVRQCQNRWHCSEFGRWRTVANVLPRSGGLRVIDRRSVRLRSVVVGCRRVSVGNAHVSCRWKGRFRWSRACRRWSVNPSRKLRRFESFTCHHVRERAFDQRKRGRRPSFLYLVGVSKTTVFWRSAGCWIAGL